MEILAALQHALELASTGSVASDSEDPRDQEAIETLAYVIQRMQWTRETGKYIGIWENWRGLEAGTAKNDFRQYYMKYQED